MVRLRGLKFHGYTANEDTVLQNHQSHRTGTDVNLIPVPSSDPRDPLRLPIWRKNLIFGLVAAYVFVSTFAINGLGPAFPQLAREFNLGAAQATYLLFYTTLNVGLAVSSNPSVHSTQHIDA